MQGASFHDAQMQGTNLGGTKLDSARLDTAIVWRSYHDEKLCSVPTRRAKYMDKNGQSLELDVDKVVSAATKDASAALADFLKSNLQLILGGSTEEKRADFWSVRGEQLSEKCTIDKHP